MTLFERVHMHSFAGATEWLNSEPLGPAELRGRVVLVNFWTLTCINWLRQEPYVRAWSHAYRDDGLVVIGVHTPEFSFEHDIDLVREAVQDRDIDSRSRLTTTTKSGLPSPTITGRRSSSPWTGTSASPSASTSATPGSKVAMGNASREFVVETESASWLGGVPSAHVVHAETDRAEVVQILRVTRRDE